MRGCQDGQGNSSTVGLRTPSTSAIDPADRFQAGRERACPSFFQDPQAKIYKHSLSWCKTSRVVRIAWSVRREGPWGSLFVTPLVGRAAWPTAAWTSGRRTIRTEKRDNADLAKNGRSSGHAPAPFKGGCFAPVLSVFQSSM